MKAWSTLGAMAVGLMLLGGEAAARVPTQINTQGVLRDAAGDLLDVPDATITFRVYAAETGGALLWSETQDLTVAMGAFSALLPEQPQTELPSAVQDKLATGAPLWLSLQLDGQAELPRTPLVSVPYAFTANRALTAVGLDCSGCIDAADINTSTFKAQHLGYEPVPGGLVNATTVGGAIAQLDDYLADHVANADAHHPADSAGLAIRPSSVAVGDSKLIDGTLDLGPGANDALTAAQVATLTSGGNADSLHAHTAQSISGLPTGGSCTTLYGSSVPACPSGYRSAQVGQALLPHGSNSAGTNLGVGAPLCIAATQNAAGGYYGVAWLAPYNGNSSFQGTVHCSVCCPAPASSVVGQGCIANAEYSRSIWDGDALGYTSYYNVPVSSTSALFKIGVKNRSYRFDRIEIGVPANRMTGEWPTGVGAVSSQDLEIVAADGTVLASAPLIRTGTTTTLPTFRGVGQNPQMVVYVYEAKINLAYAGDTPIRLRAMDVRVSPKVPVAGLLADTSYCQTQPCESTPMYNVYGCLE